MKVAKKPNKAKVKNVKAIVYKNIKFRSKLEYDTYIILESSGLNFQYEPEKIVLLPGWNPTSKIIIKGKERKQKIRDWTYTPDFIIHRNNKTVYIEMKGWGNDQLPLKRKMFLKWIEDNNPGSMYCEVYSKEELNQIIKIISSWD